MGRKKTKRNAVYAALIAAVIFLAVFPLLYKQNAEFDGSDGKGARLVEEINDDYEPWFHHIWVPPGREIENLLFVLQGVLGAGVLAYGIGYYKGRSDGKKEEIES